MWACIFSCSSAGRKLVREHGIIRYAPFALTMEDGGKEPVFDAYWRYYWLQPELRAILNGIAAVPRTSAILAPVIAVPMMIILARSNGQNLIPKLNGVLFRPAEAYCLQVQKLQKLLAREKRNSRKLRA